jgi:hypothetical protein
MRRSLATGVAVALATLLLLDPAHGAEQDGSTPKMKNGGGMLFAPDSFWNTPLPPGARIDPTSPLMIAALRAEVDRERRAGTGPWIQTHESSTPLYVVPLLQRTRAVTLETPESDSSTALSRALEEVPIPRDMRAAAGTDGHVTIWQPSTDRLWELWRARRESDGWHAEWGGAMEGVSRSPGFYSESAWPGAHSNWGATATSLPVIGGTMRIDEIERGSIDHALAIALPNARAGVFAWPAQRSDGSGGPTELPEGARLRLDPALNLDAIDLPPLTRMMAEAAQRYGIVVRDRTNNAITFFAEDPVTASSNPYTGDGGFFGGAVPGELLARFPWDRLHVLKMSLCSSAPCPRRDSP